VLVLSSRSFIILSSAVQSRWLITRTASEQQRSTQETAYQHIVIADAKMKQEKREKHGSSAAKLPRYEQCRSIFSRTWRQVTLSSTTRTLKPFGNRSSSSPETLLFLSGVITPSIALFFFDCPVLLRPSHTLDLDSTARGDERDSGQGRDTARHCLTIFICHGKP